MYVVSTSREITLITSSFNNQCSTQAVIGKRFKRMGHFGATYKYIEICMGHYIVNSHYVHGYDEMNLKLTSFSMEQSIAILISEVRY
jgi:hypothetical protein